MDKFSHYLSMASICSGRALEDKERRSEWLGWAEVWNELADDAIGHPFEERIANSSSDLAESNYEKVEWHAIEDDCWSIEALRDVNSLAASIALKMG